MTHFPLYRCLRTLQSVARPFSLYQKSFLPLSGLACNSKFFGSTCSQGVKFDYGQPKFAYQLDNRPIAFSQVRLYSDRPGDHDKADGVEKKEPEKPLSLMQRFKDAYKIYGKVLIAVHGITSILWFGSFYLLALR